MYHKVGASKDDNFLNVSASDFSRQMHMLHRMGYKAVRLDEVIRGLFHESALPRKPVCITFDDGYVNIAENASPVLCSLDWPGVIFVPGKWAGGINGWDHVNQNAVLPLLNWDKLRSLSEHGWEIAGHTHSHTHLSRLNSEDALKEILLGTEDIQHGVGKKPLTFCYPYGDIHTESVHHLKQAGYIGACTTKSGLAKHDSDPYLLPRVKVACKDRIIGLLYRMFLRPYL
jgi:peptidoglycan/xylan/chitin deacetylase (PgdA/CDA1 family)